MANKSSGGIFERIKAMRLKSKIFFLLMFGLLVSVLGQEIEFRGGIVINPLGWNIPNIEYLISHEVKKLIIPGITMDIIAESWVPEEGSNYRIPNLSFWLPKNIVEWGISTNDRVSCIIIYKTADENILCYDYWRLLAAPAPLEWHAGVISSFIIDFDDDGLYESQVLYGSPRDKEQWLASITRVKLGLSAESELLRSLVRAAVKQISEGQPGPPKKRMP